MYKVFAHCFFKLFWSRGIEENRITGNKGAISRVIEICQWYPSRGTFGVLELAFRLAERARLLWDGKS